MNNLIIIPVIVPILLGILAFKTVTQYRITISGLITLILMMCYMLVQTVTSPIILNLGGHKMPYGIQLYGDFVSLMLTLVSTIVVTAVLFYQSLNHSLQQKVPFILFILAGINGSYLTADIFNLFVMFEVMLLASFILIVIEKKSVQFKASIIYVILNLIGSWIFLIAIGILYRSYGTLSFAHLAERMNEVGYIQEHLIIIMLFLIVFSLKSALLIFIWLPRTYSVLSFELGAIFASLLTKVGVYAIYRIMTIVFVPYQDIMHQVLLAMSMLTIISGIFGVIKNTDMKLMFCYQIIISIGILCYGIATFTSTGITGTILYMTNDILIKACLFLIGGLIVESLGMINFSQNHGLSKTITKTTYIFLFIVFSVGGMPFTGGFPGKLMIIQSAIEQKMYISSVMVVIGTFAGMYAMMRLFIHLFFGENEISSLKDRKYNKKLAVIVFLLLISFSFVFTSEVMIEQIGQVQQETYIQHAQKAGE